MKNAKHPTVDLSKVAKGRIDYLLGLARQKWVQAPALSRRYVQLARKIAMRHRIRLGNRLFCKECNAPFIHGRTVKSRTIRGSVKWVCTACGGSRTVAAKGQKRGKSAA